MLFAPQLARLPAELRRASGTGARPALLAWLEAQWTGDPLEDPRPDPSLNPLFRTGEKNDWTLPLALLRAMEIDREQARAARLFVELLAQDMVIVYEYGGGQLPAVMPDYADRTVVTKTLCVALSYFLILNILLFILNLIPFPPLDGAGVLEGLYPDSAGRVLRAIRRQPFLMIGLMITVMLAINQFIWPVFRMVRGWL